MKLQISTGAVSSFARLAVIARVVCGVIIDMPELMNAGWLTVLLGGLLAPPAAFAVSQLRRTGSNPSKLLCVFFCIIAICDAATVASSIADSASYMALNTSPAVYLLLPQLALCLFCLRLNGDALGTSAGIWNRILPWILLVVILLQAKDYRPEWLTPVLGPGLPEIVTGSLRAAGWFILPTALYLIAEPGIGGKSVPLTPMKTLGVCTLFAAFICLITSMTMPAIPDKNLFSRSFRLDALLSNGRTGLAQQLPIISLWYLGLFYSLLFDMFTAAAMLQALRPDWNRHACIWIPIIITGILACEKFAGRNAALKVADWLYILQSALIAIAMFKAMLSKKGDSEHA